MEAERNGLVSFLDSETEMVGQTCMCLESTAMQVLGGCRGAASVAFMLLGWGRTVPGPRGCCHLWHSWSDFSSFLLFFEGLAGPQNKFL